MLEKTVAGRYIQMSAIHQAPTLWRGMAGHRHSNSTAAQPSDDVTEVGGNGQAYADSFVMCTNLINTFNIFLAGILPDNRYKGPRKKVSLIKLRHSFQCFTDNLITEVVKVTGVHTTALWVGCWRLWRLWPTLCLNETGTWTLDEPIASRPFGAMSFRVSRFRIIVTFLNSYSLASNCDTPEPVIVVDQQQ